MNLRKISMLGAFVGTALMALTPAKAQELPEGYPSRPIEFVVVYPAGGGMDVTARVLAKEAERVLGHSFRVQNRTGGGGLVGHAWFANEAETDGYTIGILANPNLALDALTRDGGFGTDDFLPIVGINFSPTLWTVSKNGPLAGMDFGKIIEKAKAEPGTIKISTVPNTHFDYIIDFVEQQTGAKFVRVPFQGGKPGVVALLGGNIDIAGAFYAEVEPQIRAEEITVTAVVNNERFAPLPDAPSMNEFDISIDGGVWGASRLVVVPPATSEEIRDYLEAAFLKVLNDPDADKAFREAGIVLSPTDADTAQDAYSNTVSILAKIIEDRQQN